MTSQAFVELSTRLVKDLKQWSDEATRRDRLSPEQLAVLQETADIVDSVTVTAVASDPG